MRSKGKHYEHIARKRLESQGLRPIFENYSCRTGEIDLIMQQGKQLIFVEVKYRKSLTFGLPQESVGQAKQRKIISAAKHFISTHDLWHLNARFDVVSISNSPKNNTYDIDWIKHAFSE